MTDDGPEVVFDRRGRLALVTLNRPRSINALTHAMVTETLGALERWESDPGVGVVAIVGAGERGLCAGGDIVGLYRDALRGDGSAAADFWFDEYHLNARIARYAKPVVAVQDGIVLGGGIGISAHASHRVVTERSRLGLPEVGIGFVPDVGATWLLSHAPGRLGAFLALTARSVGAADAIAVGLSDRLVRHDRIPHLLHALESTPADEALAAVADDPGESALAASREWIDDAFALESVPAILDRLRHGGGAAEAAAEEIAAKSPSALAVALESLRRARGLGSLEEALDQEFRVSRRAYAAPDFVEGVRAQVIDKDRAPRWTPAEHTLSAEDVEEYFRPLPDRELGLAAPTPSSRQHATQGDTP